MQKAEMMQIPMCLIVPKVMEKRRLLIGQRLKPCRWFQVFLGSTKKHYRAELESVDFRTAAEASRMNINNWVEEQTKGGSTHAGISGSHHQCQTAAVLTGNLAMSSSR